MGLSRNHSISELAADSPNSDVTVTIHVSNHSEVLPKMLIKAKKVAAGIFRKADVETRWINQHVNSEDKQESSNNQESFRASAILLNILTGSMTETFGLPAGRMGFVPGGGHDRQQVYVFYHRVEELARRYVEAGQEHGSCTFPATIAPQNR